MSMRRACQELAAAPTLCILGGPNYAQFNDLVHAGRTDVWAEVDHADRANDLLMGGGGLERRDEPRRVTGCADSAARTKTGGHGMGKGEAACDEGKE